ncbi:MAG: hypothetical protein LBF08_05985 [Dysgonamonadaceae bacterium]|jgi:hypothetical protein|nr:hypothetical protein [Dysgonamonadaceae bacterium]
MVTYQLQINEKMPLGKSIIDLLKSATDVVTLLPVREKTKEKEEKHSPLYYELQSAFRDVKLMIDGKKKEKTIEEFLAELRDEV